MKNSFYFLPILALALMPFPIQAMTLTVGHDIGYDELTISAAMENITPPGKIVVAPGIYNTPNGETFPIIFKSGVTLVSSSPENRPIIGGNLQSSVMTIEDVDSATLDGFVITAGKARNGGGLKIESSTVTVKNCDLERNHGDDTDGAYARGGGLYAADSSCSIIDCIFNDNDSSNGGGAYIVRSSVRMERCLISKNKATASKAEEAGGLFFGEGRFFMRDSSVIDNESTTIGGLKVDGEEWSILNCKVLRNSGTTVGGILAEAVQQGKIVDCEICGNQASTSRSSGGGIFCGGTMVLSNLIVCGNSSGMGGGIYVSEDGNQCEIRNSIIAANHARAGGGGIAWTNPFRPPLLSNSLIIGNSAQNGGGIYFNGPGFPNSIPSDFPMLFANSILVGNTAQEHGGGIYLDLSSVFLGFNCILLDNVAGTSGNWLTSRPFYGDGMGLSDSEAYFHNSIIWNGTQGISDTGHLSIHFGHCDMEELYPGPGNISVDPVFVSSPTNTKFNGSWTKNSAYSPQTSQSTLTDASADWQIGEFAGRRMTVNPDSTQPLHFVISGNTKETLSVWGDATEIAKSGERYQVYDYHLLPNSPCIDAGSNDLYGLPGSSNWSLGDIEHHVRAWDGDGDGIATVDISPFESNSSSLVGDVDGDNRVDQRDLFEASQKWKRSGQSAPVTADQNGDNKFDQNELVIVRHRWGQHYR